MDYTFNITKYCKVMLLPVNEKKIAEYYEKKLGKNWSVCMSLNYAYHKGKQVEVYVSVSYNSKRFPTPESALSFVKKDKKVSKKFKELCGLAERFNNPSKRKKLVEEILEWLKGLGVERVRQGTSYGYALKEVNGIVYLLYPRGGIKEKELFNIYTSEDVREWLVKALKEVQPRKDKTAIRNGSKSGSEKIPIIIGDSVWCRGKYYRVFFKKSQRKSVVFDEKKSRIVVSAPDKRTAKRFLEEYVMNRIAEEVRSLLRKVERDLLKGYREQGIKMKIEVTTEKPRRATTAGVLSYVPLGSTGFHGVVRMFGMVRVGKDVKVTLHFNPLTYCLPDELRYEVYFHEFAHILQYSKEMWAMGLHSEDHDSVFYESLNYLLKRYAPKLYRHAKKVLGKEISSLKEEQRAFPVYSKFDYSGNGFSKIKLENL